MISINTSFLPPALSFFIAVVCGCILAAVFGFLIGVPVLRLRGDYLAIVTLAFGEIIKSVINYLNFTGGSKGLSKIPLYSDYNNFTVVFIIMVICIVLISNLINFKFLWFDYFYSVGFYLASRRFEPGFGLVDVKVIHPRES